MLESADMASLFWERGAGRVRTIHDPHGHVWRRRSAAPSPYSSGSASVIGFQLPGMSRLRGGLDDAVAAARACKQAKRSKTRKPLRLDKHKTWTDAHKIRVERCSYRITIGIVCPHPFPILILACLGQRQPMNDPGAASATA